MNYNTNKVQVSYFVELPQSNFPNYTNSPTLSPTSPRLSVFSLTFQLTLADPPPADISRFSRNFRKVATNYLREMRQHSHHSGRHSNGHRESSSDRQTHERLCQLLLLGGRRGAVCRRRLGDARLTTGHLRQCWRKRVHQLKKNVSTLFGF